MPIDNILSYIHSSTNDEFNNLTDEAVVKFMKSWPGRYIEMPKYINDYLENHPNQAVRAYHKGFQKLDEIIHRNKK